MSLHVTILDKTMKKTEEAFSTLNDFEPRYVLLSEVIRCEQMNLRAGTAHTKTRGEVSGGGKKPWKQKGTGRARHGSTRSPIWVGGGVTFGPRNTRNWHRKINKSARLSALKSILKDRLVGESVYLFPSTVDFSKTKDAVDLIEKIVGDTGVKNKRNIIIYTSENKENLRGFVNTGVGLLNAANLKITTLANSANLIFTPEAKTFVESKIEKN